jgi:primosomal protein N' (replication factor Y)
LAPAADPWPVVAAATDLGEALVLAPSVADAASLARRLRESGRPVALLPGEWATAAAGGCVVVGSRAAAWAPVPRLAAVVVLDAHEEVYQEERAPTWNAWQVGAERARRAGAPCVLVSPCPTLEQLDWGRLVTASRSQEREGWPALDIVDRRGDDPRQGLYSEHLVRLLRSCAPVACILNRKGRARLLACTGCTDLARCEACQGAMEQPSGNCILTCRRCGATRAVVCQSCGSARLKTLRVGVSRVREELEALANVAVGEVTAQSVEVPGTSVLVGTDALLHRLRAGAVRAVAFLDFDQELLAPRYRAGEQALALLARAARLVGGRARAGRLVVQTRLPDHEVLTAALHADPGRAAAAERPRRSELALPPAAALAQVSGPRAEAFVGGLPPSLEVLGPDDGRWLLRAPDHKALLDALAGAPRPAGRVRVEVDPLRI